MELPSIKLLKGDKKMDKFNDNKDIQMKVVARKIDPYLKLDILGSLLYQSVTEAKKEISEALEDAEGYLLDLTALKQIDSTGFGVIVNLAKRLKTGSVMIIIIKDEYIRDLFRITKLDRLFSIVESVEEALKMLKQANFQPT
jgi:anti-sigma B factor antagonist